MFKVSEIGSLPEGSVGVIKDDDGQVVQAFIRKQYNPPEEGPEFVLTESEYPLSTLTEFFDEDSVERVLTARSAEPLFPSGKPSFDWDDDADIEEALDYFEANLMLPPPGTIVLLGDTRSNFSTFVLAKKQDEQSWLISGCGYGDYETTGIKTERLYTPDSDEEMIAGEETYAGSLEVFPYTIDTSVTD